MSNIRSLIERAIKAEGKKPFPAPIKPREVKPAKDPYDDFSDKELEAEIFRRGAGPQADHAQRILRGRKGGGVKAGIALTAAAGGGGAYSMRKKN